VNPNGEKDDLSDGANFEAAVSTTELVQKRQR
jgi:hypothetical protein